MRSIVLFDCFEMGLPDEESSMETDVGWAYTDRSPTFHLKKRLPKNLDPQRRPDKKSDPANDRKRKNND